MAHPIAIKDFLKHYKVFIDEDDVQVMELHREKILLHPKTPEEVTCQNATFDDFPVRER